LVILVRPGPAHLDSYIAAMRQLATMEDESFHSEQIETLDSVIADPETFLTGLDDPEGLGPPVKLPDGTSAPRLPGFHRWMWDGEVCGTIAFRWQPGSTNLPPYCLGHIGYGVFPWKRRRGYASSALRQMISEVTPLGLPFVEVVTDLDNSASQGVILNNGGELVEQFSKPAPSGGGEAVRFRIGIPQRGAPDTDQR
jgi:predicted acetyltransferase